MARSVFVLHGALQLLLTQAHCQSTRLVLRGRDKALLGQGLIAFEVGHRLVQRSFGPFDIGTRAQQCRLHGTHAFTLFLLGAGVNQCGRSGPQRGQHRPLLHHVTLLERDARHAPRQRRGHHKPVAQPRLAILLHRALKAPLRDNCSFNLQGRWRKGPHQQSQHNNAARSHPETIFLHGHFLPVIPVSSVHPPDPAYQCAGAQSVR